MKLSRLYALAVPCACAVLLLAAPSCSRKGLGIYSVEERRVTLEEVTSFGDRQPTGVAISRTGRTFVCFPRWGSPHDLSVAQVMDNGSLRPYPDSQWNRWRPGLDPQNRFVCVQSVHVSSPETRGFLWILDAASPGMEGVVSAGPKLVKVDLETDSIVDVIRFDERAAPQKSYLNDVRVHPDGHHAYITDSGLGAIIVVDLGSKDIRRALAGHESTQAQGRLVLRVGGQELRDQAGNVPQVHADGIAIDKRGEYLYYHALTGTRLYRVRTALLDNPNLPERALADSVEMIGETPPCDGMAIDGDGNLYLTAFEDSAIVRFRPGGGIDTVIQDRRLSWPDSLAIGPDGSLYVTCSQIHLMPRFNDGISRRNSPYMLYKIANWRVRD
jgi:sugar lactone lactonase YvrE